MPTLPNARHERFAQEIAAGKTATEAYFTVAGKKDRAYASRLQRKADVVQRVAEILAEQVSINQQATAAAIEKVGLTKEWVLWQLQRNAAVSMGDQPTKVKILPKGLTVPIEVEVSMRDAAAANRALELIGKELGMFIDRREIGQPGEFENLSDAERRAAIDAIDRELARRAGEDGASVQAKPH